MSESTIDTEIMQEFGDNSIHDMFILANNISDFEKTTELLKDLCHKIEKYDNTYVLLDNNNKIIKTSNKWKITGYQNILKTIEEIEIKVKELNNKIEALDPLTSNVDTSKEEINKKIDKIEETLAGGLIEKKALDNNFNPDNMHIDKTEVINSIENNFTTNREITNNFNQELYNRINKEIVNLANSKGSN